MYTIMEIYTPPEYEGAGEDYVHSDEPVAYSLIDDYGRTLAVTETKDELLPYIYGIEEPPLVDKYNEYVPIR